MIVDLMDAVESRDIYWRAKDFYLGQFTTGLKRLNSGQSADAVAMALDRAVVALPTYRRWFSQEDLALLYTSVNDILKEILPQRRENLRVRRILFPRGMPSFAAVQAGGELGDGQTSVGYDATTGRVWVDAPAGTELTSISIDSADHIFTGDPAENLGGGFDNTSADNVFKATFGSTFGSLSFGNVAQPGLTREFLVDDLSVVGTLADGSDLGNVDLVYVPEPSTWALTSLCLLGLLACGWRCRCCAA
jgi:hypothetical protein